MPEYQQEVSIYDTNSIFKKFTTHETAISVVQGNISALISSSELTELINGGKTMYSQLMKVNLAINSFKIDISELTTKYTNVSEDYTELNSKISTFEVSLNTISGKVSNTESSLSDVKSTVAEHTTSLTGIKSSISSMQSEQSGLNSRLNTAEQQITPDAIASTVTSSAIYKDSLSGKVDAKNIISTINQTAEAISINANKINLNGAVTANENFRILLDGTIEAKNANIIGGKIRIETDKEGYENLIKLSKVYNWTDNKKYHEYTHLSGGKIVFAEEKNAFVDEYGMLVTPALAMSSEWILLGALLPNGTPDNPGQIQDYFFADYKGNVRCRTIKETSDKRLKNILGPVDSEFSKRFIMDINPVKFTWKNQSDKIHMGVIAQDIKLILGDSYGLINDESNALTLGYTEFIAPIISVIQDHEREIDKIKEYLSLERE